RAIVENDRAYVLWNIRRLGRCQLGQAAGDVRHQREVGAGREPEERDPVGIDAEFPRVRADVAESLTHVVHWSGKPMLRSQAVGERHGRDATAGEVECVAGRLARVTVHPGAAVDEHDGGRRAVDLAWPVVVEAEGG